MRVTVSTAGFLILLAAGHALAAESVNTRGGDGIAIHGYDAVAYFERGEAAKGSPDHRLEWSGATWWFASEANRDAFAAEPERYAPEYGGFCAYAMSRGDAVDVDPEAWSIVDGKLYLNYSKRIRTKWEKDIPGYVARADAAWNELLSKP